MKVMPVFRACYLCQGVGSLEWRLGQSAERRYFPAEVENNLAGLVLLCDYNLQAETDTKFMCTHELWNRSGQVAGGMMNRKCSRE